MKIVLIGSGNVAGWLGPALKKEGHKVLQVYSRSEKNARRLAAKLNAKATTHMGKIRSDADIYIIALRDDAVRPFCKKFRAKGKIVTHTSGITPATVLKKCSANYGVFYPVQTITKYHATTQSIPLCIEASNTPTRRVLATLARSVSHTVMEADTGKRKVIHLAAVFANNFVNSLYTIAEELLRKEKISFNIIKHLILETTLKVMEHPLEETQTGPAIRGDEETIRQHLKLLSGKTRYRKIYKLMTENIIQYGKR